MKSLRALTSLAGAALLALALTAPASAGSNGPPRASGPHTASARFTGAFKTQGDPQLVNFNSNKCLVSQGPNNGSPASQFDCHPEFLDQFWQFEDVGGGWFRIRNVNSGKCLVIRGPDNGSQAFQYDCLPFIDQHWRPLLDSSGSFAMLQNRNSGKCLVVQGLANGSPGFQFDCHPEFDDQWWYQL
jgi:hypothetical protein